MVALPPILVLGILILIVGRALSGLDPARLVSSFTHVRTWQLGRWRVPGGIPPLAMMGNVIAFPLYSLFWRAGRVGGRATLGQPPSWSISGLWGTLRFALAEIREPLIASLIGRPRRHGDDGDRLRIVVVRPPIQGLAMDHAIDGGRGTRHTWSGRRPVLVLAYRNWPAVYDSSSKVVMALSLRALPYVLLGSGHSFVHSHRTISTPRSTDMGPWAGCAEWPYRSHSARSWRPGWSRWDLPSENFRNPAISRTRRRTDVGSPLGLLHTGVESHLSGVALVMLGVIGLAGLIAAAALSWVRRIEVL